MRPWTGTQTDRHTDTQTRVTTIHFSWSSTHAKCNKAIADYTSSALRIPITLSRPISFAANTLQCIVSREQICPFPFAEHHPHVTHCSSGQAHSSCETDVDRFSRFCMGPKCYAVQCIVSAVSGEETPKMHLPLGISTPCPRRTELPP